MKHWSQVIEQAYNRLNVLDPHGPEADKLHAVLDEIKRAERWLLPNWNELDKPIMCLDFDGVIATYKNGWRGPGNLEGEEPIPGAIRFIEEAVTKFNVLIFSSRCNHKSGIEAIDKFMCMYGLSDTARKQLIYQPGKPSWFVCIDDRNIHFHGLHGDAETIYETFAPWYYDQTGWRHAQSQTEQP